MGIGGYLSKESSNDKEQIRCIRVGIDLGMNLLDTAEEYGKGHSEEVVGKAIKGIRDKVFIATKFSPENNSYHNVIRSVENSLKRLKTDFIDLYQVHWPNPNIPLQETIKAMLSLAKAGKVKYIGLSNFSADEFKEALRTGKDHIVSLQAEYNLFDRSIENDILPFCEANDKTLIAYSPLLNGRVTDGGDHATQLNMIAEKYGKTAAQVTLNWLFSRTPVITIPKAASEAHIRENAAACDFDLLDEDKKRIDAMFRREIKYVPAIRIRVSKKGEGNRKVYQTMQEALDNDLGFVPAPLELSKSLNNSVLIKPIKVVPSKDISNQFDYDLIEGRIRYWAWVIAFGNKPIPALVRNE